MFLKRAEAYWQSKGSNLTVARRVLCRLLVESEAPVYAELLHRKVKQENVSISVSSVYRNLRDLVRGGMAREVEGKEGCYYEAITSEKSSIAAHLICRDCGRILSIESPDSLIEGVANLGPASFEIDKITLRIEGTCGHDQCSKAQTSNLASG